MTIYIDLVFLLNLFFDFLILLTVNNTLKRNTSLLKIFFGSLVGTITMVILFIPMNTITLFIFKVITSFLMTITTFGLKDKKYLITNVSYFYMTSTVLGGFLYFLNLSFSESQNGLAFTYNKMTINYLFLVIISPIMLYIYYRERKSVGYYENFYEVKIKFLNEVCLTLNGFYDTGNSLIDPITKKRIILVNKQKLKNISLDNPLYVSYNSLNHHGLIKCLKISFIEINGKQKRNYLVGISEDGLLSNGIDCVLNKYCKEDFL